MNLSGSSSLGATGDFAGVTASAAASGGIACPSSTAAGAATICAAAVTPAGAGVLPCAPAAVPGVSGEQQRQVESRSCGRRSRSSGEGVDRRAGERSRGGLLLLTALRVVGGGAVALPQIRLRMTDLTLLLPVPGMRVLVALPGILTARLVLGRSRSSARDELGRSGARRLSPGPSGVVDDDRSSTFAGFRLARGGLGGVSVAYGLFSSGGKVAGPPRLEVLGRILPPASGRSFIRAPQRGSCRLVDCCLACLRAGVGGLPCGGGLPRGY